MDLTRRGFFEFELAAEVLHVQTPTKQNRNPNTRNVTERTFGWSPSQLQLLATEPARLQGLAVVGHHLAEAQIVDIVAVEDKL